VAGRQHSLIKSVIRALTALHTVPRTLTVAELVPKNYPLFIKPGCSSPYTQQPAICPYSEPDKSILQIYFNKVKRPLLLYVQGSRVQIPSWSNSNFFMVLLGTARSETVQNFQLSHTFNSLLTNHSSIRYCQTYLHKIT
jgi:hypothetical protein